MKSTPFVKPAAQLEFDEALDWYRKRNSELAEKFAFEVQRVFNAICDQPEIYGFVSKNVRAARTNIFSYAIFFYVDDSAVIVIAILHTSRDPMLLQSRIP